MSLVQASTARSLNKTRRYEDGTPQSFVGPVLIEGLLAIMKPASAEGVALRQESRAADKQVSADGLLRSLSAEFGRRILQTAQAFRLTLSRMSKAAAHGAMGPWEWTVVAAVLGFAVAIFVVSLGRQDHRGSPRLGDGARSSISHPNIRSSQHRTADPALESNCPVARDKLAAAAVDKAHARAGKFMKEYRALEAEGSLRAAGLGEDAFDANLIRLMRAYGRVGEFTLAGNTDMNWERVHMDMTPGKSSIMEICCESGATFGWMRQIPEIPAPLGCCMLPADQLDFWMDWGSSG